MKQTNDVVETAAWDDWEYFRLIAQLRTRYFLDTRQALIKTLPRHSHATGNQRLVILTQKKREK